MRCRATYFSTPVLVNAIDACPDTVVRQAGVATIGLGLRARAGR